MIARRRLDLTVYCLPRYYASQGWILSLSHLSLRHCAHNPAGLVSNNEINVTLGHFPEDLASVRVIKFERDQNYVE